MFPQHQGAHAYGQTHVRCPTRIHIHTHTHTHTHVHTRRHAHTHTDRQYRHKHARTFASAYTLSGTCTRSAPDTRPPNFWCAGHTTVGYYHTLPTAIRQNECQLPAAKRLSRYQIFHVLSNFFVRVRGKERFRWGLRLSTSKLRRNEQSLRTPQHLPKCLC